ncbi:Rieske 2Fe-2S domain-containing protein [Frankia tisae]
MPRHLAGCPHQASELDEGDFDGETIVCARHLWEIEIRPT